ncbi:MAG: hypothetical protein JW749_06755 [Sedimentisphaerales bacterium]|nr:hypothetical protein [Sedimentisphaerales bacterium]
MVVLVAIVGCKTPAEKPSVPAFDSAIENLSFTSEQLKLLSREKDFFIKTLEDFERQQAEYGSIINSHEFRRQKEDFAYWHRDIELRERELAMQHAINVFAAHNRVLKRKFADPNAISLANPVMGKP